MHALTGWIPERIAIRSKDESFNADAAFDRLESGLAHGRCLLTVATGELDDDFAERTGLVPSHAYAVLNLKEVNVSCYQYIKKLCFFPRRVFFWTVKNFFAFT